jgi:hypothetical protein
LGPFVVDDEHVTGLNDTHDVHVVVIYRVERGRIENVWFLRQAGPNASAH